jgi:hypothetical protein
MVTESAAAVARNSSAPSSHHLRDRHFEIIDALVVLISGV